MRWQTKETIEPKNGEVRHSRFFCFVPTVIGEQTHFLEWVEVRQVYRVAQAEGGFHGWQNECIWTGK